jgi:hypothetical protein
LWDPDHHLVGQLHGGYASCSSITSDYYGRLSRSWNGGGSSSNRLSDWLDPNGTGLLVLEGRDPNTQSAVESAGDAAPSAGSGFALTNPVRAGFEVRFRLDHPASVGLELFDAAGRSVSVQAARHYGSGVARVSLAAKGASGAPLAPGLYFVRVTLDGRNAGARKLIVIE